MYSVQWQYSVLEYDGFMKRDVGQYFYLSKRNSFIK